MPGVFRMPIRVGLAVLIGLVGIGLGIAVHQVCVDITLACCNSYELLNKYFIQHLFSLAVLEGIKKNCPSDARGKRYCLWWQGHCLASRSVCVCCDIMM